MTAVSDERIRILRPLLRPEASLTILPTTHGADEFSRIIDTLGRVWNPLHHPRDRFGRFIRTFSRVSYRPRGSSRRSATFRGDSVGFDRATGDVMTKITQVDPGYTAYGLVPGMYVQIPQSDLEVRLVRAVLSGRRARGITGGPADQVVRGIERLKAAGYGDEAAAMQQALDLARSDNLRDRGRAINQFRKLSAALDDKKAAIAGLDRDRDALTDVNDIADPTVRRQWRELDDIVGTLETARHNLGDKSLPFTNDQGRTDGNMPQVRLNTAKAELGRASGAAQRFLNLRTGQWEVFGDVTPTNVRDQVYQREGQDVLPELLPSTLQKVQQGLTRAAGIYRTTQVAPKDRYHKDKEGNDVFPGSVVVTDAGKGRSSRPAAPMFVTRIHSEELPDGSIKKLAKVRHFDPALYPGKGWREYTVTSKNMSLAGPDDQSGALRNLGLSGALPESMMEAFTAEYVQQMRSRYATPDAKTRSRLGGFFDVLPIDQRVRADANGEEVRIGDWVSGPNGELGLVSWISGTDNMVRFQMPEGQRIGSLSSKNMVKVHPAGTPGGDYAPTRSEAAAAARSLGAEQVADVIDDPNSDHVAIKLAMTADPAFRAALPAAAGLYATRDQALAAGQEPDPQVKDSLRPFDRLAAASAGQFRDPSPGPDRTPAPPTATGVTTPPARPVNQDETISPDGTRTDTKTGETAIPAPAPATPTSTPAPTPTPPTPPAPEGPGYPSREAVVTATGKAHELLVDTVGVLIEPRIIDPLRDAYAKAKEGDYAAVAEALRAVADAAPEVYRGYKGIEKASAQLRATADKIDASVVGRKEAAAPTPTPVTPTPPAPPAPPSSTGGTAGGLPSPGERVNYSGPAWEPGHGRVDPVQFDGIVESSHFAPDIPEISLPTPGGGVYLIDVRDPVTGDTFLHAITAEDWETAKPRLSPAAAPTPTPTPPTPAPEGARSPAWQAMRDTVASMVFPAVDKSADPWGNTDLLTDMASRDKSMPLKQRDALANQIAQVDLGVHAWRESLSDADEGPFAFWGNIEASPEDHRDLFLEIMDHPLFDPSGHPSYENTTAVMDALRAEGKIPGLRPEAPRPGKDLAFDKDGIAPSPSGGEYRLYRAKVKEGTKGSWRLVLPDGREIDYGNKKAALKHASAHADYVASTTLPVPATPAAPPAPSAPPVLPDGITPDAVRAASPRLPDHIVRPEQRPDPEADWTDHPLDWHSDTRLLALQPFWDPESPTMIPAVRAPAERALDSRYDDDRSVAHKWAGEAEKALAIAIWDAEHPAGAPAPDAKALTDARTRTAEAVDSLLKRIPDDAAPSVEEIASRLNTATTLDEVRAVARDLWDLETEIGANSSHSPAERAKIRTDRPAADDIDRWSDWRTAAAGADDNVAADKFWRAAPLHEKARNDYLDALGIGSDELTPEDDARISSRAEARLDGIVGDIDFAAPFESYPKIIGTGPGTYVPPVEKAKRKRSVTSTAATDNATKSLRDLLVNEDVTLNEAHRKRVETLLTNPSLQGIGDGHVAIYRPLAPTAEGEPQKYGKGYHAVHAATGYDIEQADVLTNVTKAKKFAQWLDELVAAYPEKLGSAKTSEFMSWRDPNDARTFTDLRVEAREAIRGNKDMPAIPVAAPAPPPEPAQPAPKPDYAAMDLGALLDAARKRGFGSAGVSDLIGSTGGRGPEAEKALRWLLRSDDDGSFPAKRNYTDPRDGYQKYVTKLAEAAVERFAPDGPDPDDGLHRRAVNLLRQMQETRVYISAGVSRQLDELAAEYDAKQAAPPAPPSTPAPAPTLPEGASFYQNVPVKGKDLASRITRAANDVDAPTLTELRRAKTRDDALKALNEMEDHLDRQISYEESAADADDEKLRLLRAASQEIYNLAREIDPDLPDAFLARARDDGDGMDLLEAMSDLPPDHEVSVRMYGPIDGDNAYRHYTGRVRPKDDDPGAFELIDEDDNSLGEFYSEQIGQFVDRGPLALRPGEGQWGLFDQPAAPPPYEQGDPEAFRTPHSNLRGEGYWDYNRGGGDDAPELLNAFLQEESPKSGQSYQPDDYVAAIRDYADRLAGYPDRVFSDPDRRRAVVEDIRHHAARVEATVAKLRADGIIPPRKEEPAATEPETWESPGGMLITPAVQAKVDRDLLAQAYASRWSGDPLPQMDSATALAFQAGWLKPPPPAAAAITPERAAGPSENGTGRNPEGVPYRPDSPDEPWRLQDDIPNFARFEHDGDTWTMWPDGTAVNAAEDRRISPSVGFFLLADRSDLTPDERAQLSGAVDNALADAPQALLKKPFMQSRIGALRNASTRTNRDAAAAALTHALRNPDYAQEGGRITAPDFRARKDAADRLDAALGAPAAETPAVPADVERLRKISRITPWVYGPQPENAKRQGERYAAAGQIADWLSRPDVVVDEGFRSWVSSASDSEMEAFLKTVVDASLTNGEYDGTKVPGTMDDLAARGKLPGQTAPRVEPAAPTPAPVPEVNGTYSTDRGFSDPGGFRDNNDPQSPWVRSDNIVEGQRFIHGGLTYTMGADGVATAPGGDTIRPRSGFFHKRQEDMPPPPPQKVPTNHRERLDALDAWKSAHPEFVYREEFAAWYIGRQYNESEMSYDAAYKKYQDLQNGIPLPTASKKKATPTTDKARENLAREIRDNSTNTGPGMRPDRNVLLQALIDNPTLEGIGNGNVAIHRHARIDYDGKQEIVGGWSITHTPSGISIPIARVNFKTKGDTVRAAEWLDEFFTKHPDMNVGQRLGSWKDSKGKGFADLWRETQDSIWNKFDLPEIEGAPEAPEPEFDWDAKRADLRLWAGEDKGDLRPDDFADWYMGREYYKFDKPYQQAYDEWLEITNRNPDRDLKQRRYNADSWVRENPIADSKEFVDWYVAQDYDDEDILLPADAYEQFLEQKYPDTSERRRDLAGEWAVTEGKSQDEAAAFADWYVEKGYNPTANPFDEAYPEYRRSLPTPTPTAPPARPKPISSKAATDIAKQRLLEALPGRIRSASDAEEAEKIREGWAKNLFDNPNFTGVGQGYMGMHSAGRGNWVITHTPTGLMLPDRQFTGALDTKPGALRAARWADDMMAQHPDLRSTDSARIGAWRDEQGKNFGERWAEALTAIAADEPIPGYYEPPKRETKPRAPKTDSPSTTSAKQALTDRLAAVEGDPAASPHTAPRLKELIENPTLEGAGSGFASVHQELGPENAEGVRKGKGQWRVTHTPTGLWVPDHNELAKGKRNTMRAAEWLDDIVQNNPDLQVSGRITNWRNADGRSLTDLWLEALNAIHDGGPLPSTDGQKRESTPETPVEPPEVTALRDALRVDLEDARAHYSDVGVAEDGNSRSRVEDLLARLPDVKSQDDADSIRRDLAQVNADYQERVNPSRWTKRKAPPAGSEWFQTWEGAANAAGDTGAAEKFADAYWSPYSAEENYRARNGNTQESLDDAALKEIQDEADGYVDGEMGSLDFSEQPYPGAAEFKFNKEHDALTSRTAQEVDRYAELDGGYGSEFAKRALELDNQTGDVENLEDIARIHKALDDLRAEFDARPPVPEVPVDEANRQQRPMTESLDYLRQSWEKSDLAGRKRLVMDLDNYLYGGSAERIAAWNELAERTRRNLIDRASAGQWVNLDDVLSWDPTLVDAYYALPKKDHDFDGGSRSEGLYVFDQRLRERPELRAKWDALTPKERTTIVKDAVSSTTTDRGHDVIWKIEEAVEKVAAPTAPKDDVTGVRGVEGWTPHFTKLAPGFYEAQLAYYSPDNKHYLDRYEIRQAGKNEWTVTYPGESSPDDVYSTMTQAKLAVAEHARTLLDPAFLETPDDWDEENQRFVTSDPSISPAATDAVVEANRQSEQDIINETTGNPVVNAEPDPFGVEDMDDNDIAETMGMAQEEGDEEDVIDLLTPEAGAFNPMFVDKAQSGLLKSPATRSEADAAVDSISEHPASGEQRIITRAALALKNVIVRAAAGAGKTTTIEMIARAFEITHPNRRNLYVAFNAVTAAEGVRRLPRNTESRTADSLAWAAVGSAITDKKDRNRNGGFGDRGLYTNARVVAHFRVQPAGDLTPTDVVMNAEQTLIEYMISADDTIGDKHLHGAEAGSPEAAAVLDLANSIWLDYNSPSGRMPFTNNAATKMWALTRPDLRTAGYRSADVLFWDEAQDINPVLGKILRDSEKNMQLIVVGDQNQSIYAFRGSTDLLQQMKLEEDHPLTTSYRFGPQIAGVANMFLDLLDPKRKSYRVTGGGDPGVVVEPGTMIDHDVLISRGNSGAVTGILEEMERGRRVGTAKRFRNNLVLLANTIDKLQGHPEYKNKPMQLHEDLEKFESWAQVVKAVEDGKATPKIMTLHRLASKIKPDEMRKIAKELIVTDEVSYAEVPTVENVHTGPVRQLVGGNVKAQGPSGPYNMGYWATDDGVLRLAGTPEPIAKRNKDWKLAAAEYKKFLEERTGRPVEDVWGSSAKKMPSDIIVKPTAHLAIKGLTPEEQVSVLQMLVEEFGSPEEPQKPDVVVTTAHLSKGLEWKRVKIADDFRGPEYSKTDPDAPPVMPSDEEKRLAHVAVSRAEEALDPGSLAWVFDFAAQDNLEAIGKGDHQVKSRPADIINQTEGETTAAVPPEPFLSPSIGRAERAAAGVDFAMPTVTSIDDLPIEGNMPRHVKRQLSNLSDGAKTFLGSYLRGKGARVIFSENGLEGALGSLYPDGVSGNPADRRTLAESNGAFLRETGHIIISDLEAGSDESDFLHEVGHAVDYGLSEYTWGQGGQPLSSHNNFASPYMQLVAASRINEDGFSSLDPYLMHTALAGPEEGHNDENGIREAFAQLFQMRQLAATRLGRTATPREISDFAGRQFISEHLDPELGYDEAQVRSAVAAMNKFMASVERNLDAASKAPDGGIPAADGDAPVTPSALLRAPRNADSEINPGKGASGETNPTGGPTGERNGTNYRAISEKSRDDLLQQLVTYTDKIGSDVQSIEDMRDNVLTAVAVASERERSYGRRWYRDAHKFARGLARRHGIDWRISAAVLAATSPQVAWAANMTFTDLVHRSLDPAPIVNDWRGRSNALQVSPVIDDAFLGTPMSVDGKSMSVQEMLYANPALQKAVANLLGIDKDTELPPGDMKKWVDTQLAARNLDGSAPRLYQYANDAFRTALINANNRVIGRQQQLDLGVPPNELDGQGMRYRGYTSDGELIMKGDPYKLSGISTGAMTAVNGIYNYRGARRLGILLPTHFDPVPRERATVLQRISRALGGHKTRSFYNNNVTDGESELSVTIDAHQLDLMLLGIVASRSGVFAAGKAEFLAKGKNVKEGRNGTYPIFQEGVRQAVEVLGGDWTMAQAQAVSWLTTLYNSESSWMVNRALNFIDPEAVARYVTGGTLGSAAPHIFEIARESRGHTEANSALKDRGISYRFTSESLSKMKQALKDPWTQFNEGSDDATTLSLARTKYAAAAYLAAKHGADVEAAKKAIEGTFLKKKKRKDDPEPKQPKITVEDVARLRAIGERMMSLEQLLAPENIALRQQILSEYIDRRRELGVSTNIKIGELEDVLRQALAASHGNVPSVRATRRLRPSRAVLRPPLPGR